MVILSYFGYLWHCYQSFTCVALLIKRELDRRPLEERQFTLKQIYAGMGLAHLAIILAGVYRLLTVRDAEWRLIIIVVIVLDICLLAFLTPRVLKIIKQSERG